MILGVDIETCSAADIDDGAAAYAAHESTRVYCVVFTLSRCRGDHQTHRWFPGRDRLPTWVTMHILNGLPVLAHNAPFEASIFEHILVPHCGFPAVKTEQWLDSLSVAAALNLPLSLGNLGAAIGAAVLKDAEGAKLMKQLAVVKVKKGAYVYPTVTTEQLNRLADYCERDVLSMLDCWWKMPALPPEETATIVVDRRINARGVLLDQALAAAMERMATVREREIGAAIWQQTNDLLTVTNVPALKGWLLDRGVALPKVVRKKTDGTFTATESIDRASMAEILARPGVPPDVRNALEMRIEVGRMTSLAKATRVPAVVSPDGRFRYALRYSKAHPGRWSSEVLQLHNLARSTKEFRTVMAEFTTAVRMGNIDLARGLHPVLDGLSFLLRSLVIAKPGHDLIGGDFAQVEARILAWVAGQHDVLAMFASGADVYTADAANVGSDNRQLGKVQRLGLGYGMGPLKFRDTAADPPYNLAIEPKRAREVVEGWRANNPKIVAFWSDIESACVEAMECLGCPVFVGDHIHVIANKECLRIVLPSGRAIHCWRPHRRPVTKTIEVINADGEIETREFSTVELRFFTPSKTGMEVESTYGGKLTENIVQGIARDLLRDALLLLDKTIYDVVLHVHDSIAAEVPEGVGSVEEFCRLMATVPAWAPGLPVAAEGYRSRHFKG